ncbi:diguanylate cyclase (GGDEF) domain-containing protein [Blastococcus aurantiacus]|uniref:Diguanylate cyclase (GGDEF) domain-containing protein n=1 Tax=Blastococcus aurantiacus TaxID=1550231 RepID=A0A1G7JH30_9ACTN|nr:bifunctional diguanylate cyclase/phosphodiesterase [Blastococcus aurantiacus]SDF24094.1 diguanylate cyclase (GGDEF) domain-containing protein [Blastococcus aurantiacus]
MDGDHGHTGAQDDRTPRRLGRTGRLLCVAVLVAVLLAIALAVGIPGRDDPALLDQVHLPWWVLALAFIATETFVLNVQVRRETQTISLSEIPLVLGLFFAAPLPLLLARVVANAAVMVVVRRSPPVKMVFNVALLIGSTCVAISVFSALAPSTGELTASSWLAAYAAALLADVLCALAIGAMIAVHDGGVNVRGLLTEAGSVLVPALGVTIGLLAVTSLVASTSSAWLLVALGAGLLVGFRAYASLAERHLNLERLYRFSQAVSSTPGTDELMGNVLTEAREILRAEHATVVFVASDGGLVARIGLGATGRLTRSEAPPSEQDAWMIREVVDGGGTLLMPRGTRDPRMREWLEAAGVRDAVAVPLTGGAGIVGVLVVADRWGDVKTFEPDDVLLLETVTNHAGVALRNGELIGRLRHDALHDALTGLPNRTLLQRELAAALEAVASGRSAGAAVMVLDLDGFKSVNDTLGHQQGDALLVEVGARLTAALGRAGTVGRLSGDEFAVVLTGADDEEAAVRVGRRVLRALEHPVVLDGLEVVIGASLGIALAPAHGDDPAGLLKRADLAMYDAKTSTRSLRVYEADLDADHPRRLTLASDLRTALQQGDLQVHVQPQARLDTDAVVGVEALVRWEHPRLGWVSPDEFVPVAERAGLIGALTSQVLEIALAAVASWRAAGRDLGIAVNLSTRSLQDPDLVDEIARLLRRHDVPAARLTLEVTESSVMGDPARAVALLHQLRDLGVRLSVDDFGTGYSSLSYLQRLPVQEVKIDRSFVAGLDRGTENVAIVRAIVDLGRNLGLDVVAEGVEDQATRDRLAAMDCDLLQGWHLARAMPVEELLPWLTARDQAPHRRTVRAVDSSRRA